MLFVAWKSWCEKVVALGWPLDYDERIRLVINGEFVMPGVPSNIIKLKGGTETTVVQISVSAPKNPGDAGPRSSTLYTVKVDAHVALSKTDLLSLPFVCVTGL